MRLDTYEVMTNEQSLMQAQQVIRSVTMHQHDRPSLVAQIVSEIGAEIIEGILPVGHDLNTVDLAKRYHTSRTPVREALIVLENEGLVEIPPRRRPMVREYSLKEAQDIYRTRAALLEFVAGDVANRSTRKELDELREILVKTREAMNSRDVLGYLWLNVKFTHYNTRIARNPTVKRIIDSLLLKSISMRRLNLSQDNRMEESLSDHERLLDAYERKDAYMASAILRSNHHAALARVERYYKLHGTIELKGPLAQPQPYAKGKFEIPSDEGSKK